MNSTQRRCGSDAQNQALESEPPSCTGDQPEESVPVESSEPEPEEPERFPDEQPTLDRLS